MARPSTMGQDARMPYVVGLTGGIGSGKSTVAQLFEQHGIAIVDTDVIAHELTTPGGLAIAAIRHNFGDDFIDSDGAMDRARMREHVFNNEAARRQLQDILHPMIRSESRQRVLAAQSAYVILVVPLLFESGRWKESAHRTLVVDCPEPEQIQRVRRRSNLSEAQVRAIMATQTGRAERLRLADDVIDNGATESHLVQEVERLHAKYLDMAKIYHSALGRVVS